MNCRLAVLALVLACAVPAFASPAPEGGKFAFPGGPTFEKGAWLGTVVNYPMVMMNDAAASGEVHQYVSLNGSVTTVLLQYDSYQCEDANTYRAILKGKSYPSGADLTLCAMVAINGTNRTATMTPLDQGCPDVSYGEFKTTSGLYYFGATSWVPVPGVLPARTVTTCANSTKPAYTGPPVVPANEVEPIQPLGAPGAAPLPAPTVVVKPPAYPSLGQPKSAQTQVGLWAGPNILQIRGTTDQGTAQMVDGQLQADRGAFPTYVCLSTTSFATTTQSTTIYLYDYNNPVKGNLTCVTGSRTANTMVVTAKEWPAPCPSGMANATFPQVATTTLRLLEPLAKVPDPTCKNVTFPAPPKVLPPKAPAVIVPKPAAIKPTAIKPAALPPKTKGPGAAPGPKDDGNAAAGVFRQVAIVVAMLAGAVVLF